MITEFVSQQKTKDLVASATMVTRSPAFSVFDVETVLVTSTRLLRVVPEIALPFVAMVLVLMMRPVVPAAPAHLIVAVQEAGLLFVAGALSWVPPQMKSGVRETK